MSKPSPALWACPQIGPTNGASAISIAAPLQDVSDPGDVPEPVGLKASKLQT